jgi:hypothetical protein
VSFTTTLQKALNVSSTEYVEGAEVSAYHYPGDTLDDKVHLYTANDSEFTFDLQQEIEVDSKGYATAKDVEGFSHRIYFEVNRPLNARDMGVRP